MAVARPRENVVQCTKRLLPRKRGVLVVPEADFSFSWQVEIGAALLGYANCVTAAVFVLGGDLCRAQHFVSLIVLTEMCSNVCPLTCALRCVLSYLCVLAYMVPRPRE